MSSLARWNRFYINTEPPWRRGRGGTWHAGWCLLTLVTILLSLWTLRLVKVKTKYFWLVMWPRNWSVTWLRVWIFLILSHHTAKFGVHTLYESGNITFFICQVTTTSKYHVTLWVGCPHLRHQPAKFGVHRPCEGGVQRLWFATWPHNGYIAWLCRSGPLILSYHLATFWDHRPCESGNITFSICCVTTISKCHVTLW